MSLSLVTQILKESRLKGSKPRIAIEITALKKSLSPGETFVVNNIENDTDGVCADINTFTGTGTKWNTDGDDEQINISTDKLIISGGDNAGTYSISVVNADTSFDITGDIFSTYPSTNETYQIQRTYTGLVKSAPKITQRVSRMGGVATKSGLSFDVINPGLFSNLFATFGNPENETVRIYILYDDGTNIEWAEKIQIFHGAITDFPTITYDTVSFQAENQDALTEKTIGTLLTDSDAYPKGVGSQLPEETKGKIKPIVYGNMEMWINANDPVHSQLASTQVWDRNNKLSEMAYLGEHLGEEYWMVSGHQVDNVTQIWAYSDKARALVEMVDWSTVQNTSSGCIIKRTGDRFREIRFPYDTIDGPWTFPQRAHDSDVTTYATAELVNGDPQFHTEPLTLQFRDSQIPIADVDQIRIYAVVAGDLDSSYYLDFGAGNHTITTPDSTIFRKPSDIDNPGSINSVLVAYTKGVTGGTTKVCRLYAAYLIARYEDTSHQQLYFGGKGREYGTWINGRATTEGFDENHQDDDGNGNLIENAAGAIESILRDELSFVDADINRNSFNTSSNDVSTSVFAFSIIEQINSTELLNDILKTIKSTMFFNNVNEILIRTYRSGDPFNHSGLTPIPAAHDVFDFTPRTTFIITTGVNDKLDFLDNSGPTTYTLTLDAGTYTGATLATEIQTKFGIIGTADTISVSYSASTGKFTITNHDGIYQLRWSNGSNTATSVGRTIGFDLNADDTGSTAYTSNFATYADSFEDGFILDNSLSLRRTSEPLKNDVTVLYSKGAQGTFSQSTNDTDSTHSETLAIELEHLYTKDTSTAELYRDFFLDRRKVKYYEAKFRASLDALWVELGDFINIRHPLLNGMLGAAEENQKWQVVGLITDLNALTVEITAVEV